MRQGISQFITRGTALALLTALVAACGGRSMAPSIGSNSMAPSNHFGPAALKYKFRALDDPADPTFNQLLGIDRSKTIVGYFGSGNPGHPNKGYRLTPPYKPTDFGPENFPGSAQTQVVAINNLNDTAGFWVDAKKHNHGFIHWNGAFKSYSLGKSAITQILGLNNSGLAVGFYVANKTNVGFVFDRLTGKATTVGPKGATNVMATGINNQNDIVGIYVRSGQTVGFLKVGNAYHTLIYPKSASTSPFGINNHGDIAGSYVDSAGATHGFLLQSPLHNGVWTKFDDPAGVGTTTINGVNDRLDLVGFYTDSKGNTDGMLASRI
jgi:hypothetical protein